MCEIVTVAVRGFINGEHAEGRACSVTALQVTVPHERDRCIHMDEVPMESRSFCSTLGQDANGALPIVTA